MLQIILVNGHICPIATDGTSDDTMTSDPCMTHAQKRDEATRLCGIFSQNIFEVRFF